MIHPCEPKLKELKAIQAQLKTEMKTETTTPDIARKLSAITSQIMRRESYLEDAGEAKEAEE